MVACDIVTPVLWRLLVMSLTVVLGFFFKALKTPLLSTSVVFFVLYSVHFPQVLFFLKTFQTVNTCQSSINLLSHS
uniref:Uncharacterized protein n=1 Tax=Anguilla anguilla TaxID=7936 RepID=A0A0E9SGW6_ANGAN